MLTDQRAILDGVAAAYWVARASSVKQILLEERARRRRRSVSGGDVRRCGD